MSTTVPRVASSPDDLRVGQVVAVDAHGLWKVGTIRHVGDGGAMVQLQGFPADSQSAFGFDIGAWVILSDPPPEPVAVSREAFDRLAELVDDTRQEFATKGQPGSLLWTAGSVVDEVRGQA